MAVKLTRREFVRASAAGLAAASLVPGTVCGQGEAADLVVVEGEIIAAARKAISSLGGISRFVKAGSKVLIKPNISFATAVERGANTTPELVAEVAAQCVAAGAKEVLVTDLPLQPETLCLWRNGVKDAMAKVPGARLQYLSDERFYKEVAIPQGRDLKKAKLMKPLLEADVIINIPRAKSHNATVVTLGLKNLMGVAYDRKSFHALHKLDQAIADLATLVRPQLTIIDASKVMVDNGPGGPGTLVPLNMVVAGVNPLEADAVMVSLTSWEGRKYSPAQVKHLQAAHERGLGRIDLGQIKYSRLKV